MKPSGKGFRRFGQHRALIGNKLMVLRRKRGMSQKRLSEVLGISTTQVCEYERGSDNVPFEAIIRISDLLGVPLDYFRPMPGDVVVPRQPAGRPRTEW